MSSIDFDTNEISELVSYLRNKDNVDLFLVNTSDVNGRKKRTELHFNLRDGGQSQSIVLPDTWIPVNVGIKVESLTAFSRSESFLRFVDLGYIRAIDAEYARKVLHTGDARSEQRRMFDSDANDVAFDLESGGVAVSKARDETRMDINPKIAQIMMNKTLEDEKRYAALRNIQSEITQKDLPFIMQHAKSERIKTWVNGLKLSVA